MQRSETLQNNANNKYKTTYSINLYYKESFNSRPFLVDRTNARAYATVLHPSVVCPSVCL